MKQKILYSLILLVMSFGASAQYYINLGDETGFDVEPFEDDLEQSAQRLVESIPSEYQDSFKVITRSIYITSRYFDEATQDLFLRVKQKVEIDYYYYVLIVKISSSEDLNDYYLVDINLPDISLDGCLPNLELIAKIY